MSGGFAARWWSGNAELQRHAEKERTSAMISEKAVEADGIRAFEPVRFVSEGYTLRADWSAHWVQVSITPASGPTHYMRLTHYEFARLIAQCAAVLPLHDDQRERYALLAEGMAARWVNGEATTLYGQAYQAACRNVAAAIRAMTLPHNASDGAPALIAEKDGAKP